MNLDITKVDWKAMPTAREKTIFYGALFFFFIFFLRSCWFPSMNAITAVQQEMNDAMKEKSEIESPAGFLGMPSQKWLGTEEKRGEYLSAAKKLSDSPNIVMMREFSNPALLRGLKLIDIKFEQASQQKGVLTQPWKLSLYGSFVSVGSYLERLESLPMLLIIDNIDIKTSNDPLGHVSAEVSGTGYGWK